MRLNEHYVNVFTPEDKEKYIDDVYRLIEYSYKDIGGAKGLSKDELMEDGVFFKLVRKNNKIVACAVYSYRSAATSNVSFFDPKRDERKIKYVAQDGSDEGKAAVKTIMHDDIVRPERGFWGEVSGKVEQMYMRRGAVPIPNTIAVQVLRDFKKKPIDKLDPDGYHYWRPVGGGKSIRKMMVGNANIVSQGLGHREDARKAIDDAPEYDINSAKEDHEVSEGLTILEFVKKSMEE